ncbi:MAG TPA: Fe-S cluster assembly protein SufD [Acidimicrobiales bacterium]|nr:Fe-S cluster assembly protein SufD [Acidimicrobiales bacterium]
MTTALTDLAAALGGPAWLAERRMAAAEEAAAAPMPSASQEVWRYSPIDDLDIERYTAAPAPAERGGALTPLADVDRAALVVVRDGAVVRLDIEAAAAAQGLTVTVLDGEAVSPEFLGASIGEADAFTLRNDALASAPIVVRVPRNVVVEQPIVVVHEVTVTGSMTFPRLLVEAAQSSELTVLDITTSPDVEALVAPVVELHAAANATLRHQSIQDHGPRVWQIGMTGARIEQDARVVAATVALGGAYARIRTDSKVVGQNGRADLLAAYFGGADQIHDFRTLQDHHAPRTTSELLFKGAVTDTARSVYSGLIRIRHGAVGTAAFQTNRNLVLGDGAHADSVPNLEIEENDVKCSHASAVGPVDEDQLYYLEARGVPTDVAERLIVLGFFDDVIDRMPVKELRDLLRLAVATKLDQRTS